MKLSNIFKGAPNIEIESLNTDSRKQSNNSMFFCLDGLLTNGHQYIKQAIKKGAICIVHSEDVKDYVEGIAYIKVDDVTTTLNKVITKFYDSPSEELLVFGVTGTNGKSTVTNIIKDIYDHYAPCGYIGTISITYQDVQLAPDLTTPDPIYLNYVLKEMVDAGVKAVALEVSSHGLEQKRVDAIDFDIAVFTNFSYDHLDFHGTIENYFAAKRKLFENLKPDGICVLNVDDNRFQALKDSFSGKIVSYGVEQECDYRASNIRLSMNCSEFDLTYKGKVYPVTTNLVATYNIYNLLAAIASVVESGQTIESVLSHVTCIKQVEGRLEIIHKGQPFNVIVDFAHTPDGLEKIYEFAKEITPEGGSIISVFGSAGRRDKAKRKVFGEVSSKYCNMIILTEDDPRDEDARKIAEEIKTGVSDQVKNIYIADRYDAIRQAIEQANPNDTVLILGKGDEVFMYRENGREPWKGDHVVAAEVIEKYYLDTEEKEVLV